MNERAKSIVAIGSMFTGVLVALSWLPLTLKLPALGTLGVSIALFVLVTVTVVFISINRKG